MKQKIELSRNLRKDELFGRLLMSLDPEESLEIKIVKFSDEQLDQEIEKSIRKIAEIHADDESKMAFIEQLKFTYKDRPGMADVIENIRKGFDLPPAEAENVPIETEKTSSQLGEKTDDQPAGVFVQTNAERMTRIPKKKPVPRWATELEEEICQKQEAAYDPLHRRRNMK